MTFLCQVLLAKFMSSAYVTICITDAGLRYAGPVQVENHWGEDASLVDASLMDALFRFRCFDVELRNFTNV